MKPLRLIDPIELQKLSSASEFESFLHDTKCAIIKFIKDNWILIVLVLVIIYLCMCRYQSSKLYKAEKEQQDIIDRAEFEEFVEMKRNEDAKQKERAKHISDIRRMY